MLQQLGALGGIILVDLALSGDNALVIGAAAAALPRVQRRIAIIAGGGGAIVLRIIAAAAATFLLELPLLQAIGGLLLIYIAWKLLHDRVVEEEHKAGSDPSKNLLSALFTILIADVTMSLDNVLAIGALAHGDIPLLVIGLALSMAILLAGSSVVATLIGKLPWLLDVAALVLGWTAGGMVALDLRVKPLLAPWPWAVIASHAAGAVVVLGIDLWLRWRERQDLDRMAAATKDSAPVS